MPLDVYYTSSEAAQSQYLSMYQEQGLKVLVMPLFLDNHFIQFIEMKQPRGPV